jgi:hypothetical protein
VEVVVVVEVVEVEVEVGCAEFRRGMALTDVEPVLIVGAFRVGTEGRVTAPVLTVGRVTFPAFRVGRATFPALRVGTEGVEMVGAAAATLPEPMGPPITPSP